MRVLYRSGFAAGAGVAPDSGFSISEGTGARRDDARGPSALLSGVFIGSVQPGGLLLFWCSDAE